MNPFTVNRMIKKSSQKICIDTLSRDCGMQMRHRFFKMSKELFACPDCGMMRHYVKGLSFYGWLHMPFYSGEKINF